MLHVSLGRFHETTLRPPTPSGITGNPRNFRFLHLTPEITPPPQGLGPGRHMEPSTRRHSTSAEEVPRAPVGPEAYSILGPGIPRFALPLLTPQTPPHASFEDETGSTSSGPSGRRCPPHSPVYTAVVAPDDVARCRLSSTPASGALALEIRQPCGLSRASSHRRARLTREPALSAHAPSWCRAGLGSFVVVGVS